MVSEIDDNMLADVHVKDHPDELTTKDLVK